MSSEFLLVVVLVPVLFWFVVAIFQTLWNCTIPGIFKLREISFWEAFRLLLIAAFLSGGSFVRFNVGG